MSLIVGGVGRVARANIWEISVWMVKEAFDFLRRTGGLGGAIGGEGDAGAEGGRTDTVID